MSLDDRPESERLRERILGVCSHLGAVAAGYWSLDIDGGRLVQVVFVPGASLDPEVGRSFAAATFSVPLEQTGLGIVSAALNHRTMVSTASELPPDCGSGRWLRAFGAARSVAVPVSDEHGNVRGVISIALPETCGESASKVGDRLLQALSE